MSNKTCLAVDMVILGIGAVPHLTAAPTMYPLVLAAQDAAGKI